jgi:hypothetical protein
VIWAISSVLTDFRVLNSGSTEAVPDHVIIRNNAQQRTGEKSSIYGEHHDQKLKKIYLKGRHF